MAPPISIPPGFTSIKHAVSELKGRASDALTPAQANFLQQADSNARIIQTAFRARAARMAQNTLTKPQAAVFTKKQAPLPISDIGAKHIEKQTEMMSRIIGIDAFTDRSVFSNSQELESFFTTGNGETLRNGCVELPRNTLISREVDAYLKEYNICVYTAAGTARVLNPTTASRPIGVKAIFEPKYEDPIPHTSIEAYYPEQVFCEIPINQFNMTIKVSLRNIAHIANPERVFEFSTQFRIAPHQFKIDKWLQDIKHFLITAEQLTPPKTTYGDRLRLTLQHDEHASCSTVLVLYRINAEENTYGLATAFPEMNQLQSQQIMPRLAPEATQKKSHETQATPVKPKKGKKQAEPSKKVKAQPKPAHNDLEQFWSIVGMFQEHQQSTTVDNLSKKASVEEFRRNLQNNTEQVFKDRARREKAVGKFDDIARLYYSIILDEHISLEDKLECTDYFQEAHIVSGQQSSIGLSEQAEETINSNNQSYRSMRNHEKHKGALFFTFLHFCKIYRNSPEKIPDKFKVEKNPIYIEEIELPKNLLKAGRLSKKVFEKYESALASSVKLRIFDKLTKTCKDLNQLNRKVDQLVDKISS